MHLSTSMTASIAVSSALGMPAPAMGHELRHTAQLSARQATPPNDSAGSGSLEISYDPDSDALRWTITYEGLADVTAAKFFRDDATEPTLAIAENLASPITGWAEVSDEEYAELATGHWMLVICTEAFPEGEIAGPLTAAAEAA